VSEKYTFTRKSKDLYGQTKKVTHKVEAETLPEILEEMLYFLNGCSFTWLKDLIIVKEDGTEVPVVGYTERIEELADELNRTISINNQ
jgi:hypothetical protein